MNINIKIAGKYHQSLGIVHDIFVCNKFDKWRIAW